MAEVDAKGIGLAAKDIVLGVGTVAAGATLGPAGAEGVNRAGGALDRILKMTGVIEQRAENFDRADFAARTPQKGGMDAPSQTAQAESGGQKDAEKKDSAPLSAPATPLQRGDGLLAQDHLTGLGWPSEAVRLMLQGPDRAAAASAQAPVAVAEEAPARPLQPPIHSPFQSERAGYAPDLRAYDADALMLRGVGISTERLEPNKEA